MKSKNNSFEINHILKSKNNCFVLLELKGGILCSGKILKIDEFFNILLEETFLTSKNGLIFKKVPAIFLKGKTIKNIRFY
ncbi:snrpD (nucleomorph) [Hemiselmis andersenii]|uniref:SnrpD n=1 Tax=Hemiselmis andersenii TaxID=464988 RepID=A9BLD6_HEMAN|nr:snrpD [Hemiselmis andersenii]ABW98319.1 snrpD [Hemiselmis andersenii]|mmetsp:Transcript_41733/g.101851  ORF Transcript_41733/g.101851 Transcript_41733/m.101851 type:complete len:80 (+) Transcript_41733:1836-2075(+)